MFTSLLYENDIGSYHAVLTRQKLHNVNSFRSLLDRHFSNEINANTFVKCFAQNLKTICDMFDICFNSVPQLQSIAIGKCSTFGLERHFKQYRYNRNKKFNFNYINNSTLFRYSDPHSTTHFLRNFEKYMCRNVSRCIIEGRGVIPVWNLNEDVFERELNYLSENQ